ncbi:MAG TPA: trypsin-like serine protease [Chloroflexi bacterium]|nr:trypsin-like serine protease [Chloroflexota bacterium]
MKSRTVRIVRTILTTWLLLAFLLPAPTTSGVASASSPVQQPPPPPVSPAKLQESIGAKAGVQPNRPTPRVIGESDPEGATPAIYIVQLRGQPLASYRGGIADLAPTSPAVTGAALDAAGRAAQAYLGYLTAQQQAILTEIQAAVGRPVTVKFTYRVAFNGFALELTPREAAAVARLDGVQLVQRDFVDQPQTDYGPAWIGAPAVWNGLPGTKGEGIVAGIIDTGINFRSPSFARAGGDGYVHTNPRGKFYGVCDPANAVYDPTFVCTEKLIGAWDFADGAEPPDGPADNDGHGSHTASTVAGNVVSASLVAPTTVYAANISGVAPHANIIAYDACGLEGCPGSALVAAIDQAVTDGVDVINYSIGGGSRDPWRSADALAFLAALDAGVYVAVSAGNAGPGASTMGSPANAPWVTAVAAATHNRLLANGVISMTGGLLPPPADMAGKGITGPYGPAPIVYAGNYTSTLGSADPKCLQPFPPGSFNGEIVVCDRGANARVAKAANVRAGGAGGFVLANDAASGASLSADAYALPGAHITYADGVALKNWIAAGGVTTATIAGVAPNVNNANGDILAAFSSRGPDATSPNVLKPDVAAPGVDIFAAVASGIEYNIISGTSMASPHTAGAGVLLSKLHPTWSPAAIRSALMMTAKTALLKDDAATPADPFDIGAGRVDVAAAAQVGFVLDENARTFYAASPALGGDPRTLNVASLADAQCVGACTWTRTLTSVATGAHTYTVTVTSPTSMTLTVQPNTFTLPPGGTQVLTITADVSAAALDAWIFGQVTITPENNPPSTAHMPVAVYTRAGAAPLGMSEITIDTRRNQGQTTLEGIRAVSTLSLTKALYLGAAQVITGYVAQDPTNGDPYDINNGGVYTTLVTISDPTTARLRVDIDDTTAIDLDLFVGKDTNGNGQPDPSEELCRSASASAFEFCDLADPTTGNYWILLQNWLGSGAPLDFFAMSATQVSRNNQSASFTVSGPNSATLNTPFDLVLQWNFDPFAAGNIRLALLEVGTDPNNPNNILALPVTLTRQSDDVTIDSNAAAYVQPGERLNYTININPEPTAANPTSYTVTATLPAGLTYVPGSGVLASSAQRIAADPVVNGNQLIWQVNNIATAPRYVMSDNNPASQHYSPQCTTPFGASFLHLADFGIEARSAISGTGRSWNVDAFFGGEQPYEFYGDAYPALFLTDDALLSVVGYDAALNSGVNAPIPTPALPNALLAPYWADFKVVYNQPAGAGVRIAGADGGALMVVEYDGLQRNDGQPGSFDVQTWVMRAVDPDYPEIVFAYDNITGTLPAGVIGIEDRLGASGIPYTDAISNNLLICYDWAPDQIELTYAVDVKADAPLNAGQTTVVESTLTSPNTGPATTENTVFVTGVVLEMSIAGPAHMLPGAPVTYTLTVTNSGVAAAQNLTVMAELPLGSRHIAGGTVQDGIVTFPIATLGAGAATQLRYSVQLADVPTAAEVAAATAHSPAIVGGAPADPGEYPWQAALLYASDGSWWGCGGSLLTPTWVATAAHCVTSGSLVAPPSALNVAVGRYNINSTQGQRIAVAEVLVHPDWDFFTYDNDVALLRLATPAVLTTTVQTIPLATAYEGSLFAPGVPATVTGWGTRTSGADDFPDELYEVQTPIVEQSACQFAYGTVGETITDNMICAGLVQGGKDSCQGDSGGPLVVPAGSGFKLAGIVSWGQGCAQPGFPGVYTRVAAVANWIAQEQATLRTGRYMVTDGSGLPGHSYVGNDIVTTLVQALKNWLPVVSK